MNDLFKDLVVLDLSRYLLGAYTSLYFADLGARVIKVEDTKTGDYCRQEQPQKNGESYYHYALNRNKESVSFNLKDPDVRDAFYELVKKADILIENFRPGVTKRLGIDYPTLSAINPGIIYCSFSAYGQEDPLSLKPLHDINIVAETGFYDLNEGNVALLPPADFAATMVGLQGILTGLYQRQQTGKGSHVDAAMYDSLVWWNAMLDSRWFFYDKDFPSTKREYPAIGYNVYHTKDNRLLAFGFYETSFWNDFCADLGREDLFNILKDTPTENEAGYKQVCDLVASKTYDEWTAWLADKDHCITPVLNKTEAIELATKRNPHALRFVTYPRLGTVLQTNTPHIIGDVRSDLNEAREPEQLGQSSVKILIEQGASIDKIQELLNKGAVRCN